MVHTRAAAARATCRVLQEHPQHVHPQGAATQAASLAEAVQEQVAEVLVAVHAEVADAKAINFFFLLYIYFIGSWGCFS